MATAGRTQRVRSQKSYVPCKDFLRFGIIEKNAGFLKTFML